MCICLFTKKQAANSDHGRSGFHSDGIITTHAHTQGFDPVFRKCSFYFFKNAAGVSEIRHVFHPDFQSGSPYPCNLKSGT